MAFPICNQSDIPHKDARLAYERRHWDDQGYERTARRNGAYQCPKCELWWPIIEEPDCWTQSLNDRNRMDAEGWWGAAVCEKCQLLMVDQPDGVGECYDLSGGKG